MTGNPWRTASIYLRYKLYKEAALSISSCLWAWEKGKGTRKKTSNKLGSTSSTLEFKLILKFLWQLENKLSDEKEVKTVHEEKGMLPSPKKQDKELEKSDRQTDTNGLLLILCPKFKIQAKAVSGGAPLHSGESLDLDSTAEPWICWDQGKRGRATATVQKTWMLYMNLHCSVCMGTI